MKLSKFLHCENPLVNDQHDGRAFILHTRDPLIIAEIFPFEDLTEEKRMNFERGLAAFGRLDNGDETFYFVPVKFLPDEKFNKLSPQEQSDELSGIMRRMADWYEAYLIWEDS